MLLAVGPSIEYVAVQTFNQYTGSPVTVVLAKNLLDSYFPAKNAQLKLEDYQEGDKNIPFRVLEKTWKGTELAGLEYDNFPLDKGDGKSV